MITRTTLDWSRVGCRAGVGREHRQGRPERLLRPRRGPGRGRSGAARPAPRQPGAGPGARRPCRLRRGRSCRPGGRRHRPPVRRRGRPCRGRTRPRSPRPRPRCGGCAPAPGCAGRRSDAGRAGVGDRAEPWRRSRRWSAGPVAGPAVLRAGAPVAGRAAGSACGSPWRRRRRRRSPAGAAHGWPRAGRARLPRRGPARSWVDRRRGDRRGRHGRRAPASQLVASAWRSCGCCRRRPGSRPPEALTCDIAQGAIWVAKSPGVSGPWSSLRVSRHSASRSPGTPAAISDGAGTPPTTCGADSRPGDRGRAGATGWSTRHT